MADRNHVKRPRPLSDRGSETEEPLADQVQGSRKPNRRRRDANVYDAVAGRVTTTLPLDGTGGEVHVAGPMASHSHRRSRDRPGANSSRRDPVLAPEEVLFRRAGAPLRFAEKDIYHASDRLQHHSKVRLPDSDLLKTIHSYASHFYKDLAAPDARVPTGAVRPGKERTARAERTGPPGNTASSSRALAEAGTRPNLGLPIDEYSMDETALLAFGIILEEAAQEAVGRTGDLVFTEGVPEAQQTDKDQS